MSKVVASAELAGACRSFLEHWKGLRDGALVPSLDVWLTHLPASIATHKFRAELLPDDALVLFNGSANIARRGRNNTGGSLLEGDEARGRANLANLRTIVATPCGLVIDLLYRVPGDLSVHTQTIVLPLNLPTGRWPQVVGYTCEFSPAPPKVAFQNPPARIGVSWIDVGCGLPTAAPA